MTVDGSKNRRPPLVSIVAPAFNEEECLPLFYKGVRSVMEDVGYDFELVIVDNGSTDGSLQYLREVNRVDPKMRYVSLSRNFGHQGALCAGLRYSRGDGVITMDADLQHPPSLIPEMVRLWREGFEVVYTKKRNSQLPGLRWLQVRFFYWILSKLSGLKLSFGQSDFRLLDRKVVDILLGIPEYRKFLRGLVEWVGFRQVGLEYDVAGRHAGQSKFSYRSLVSFALDGILAFSFVPLRWSLVAGVVVALACLLYAVVAVGLGALNLLGANVVLPPGWATLAASITFLASVQLVAIGLLSEYMGRTYEQVKGRPVFIVKEVSDTEDISCLKQ